MNSVFDIPTNPRPIYADICVCGHPVKSHTLGPCEGSLGTCNCKKIWQIFSVLDPQSFSRPHLGIGEGHALIQGVLNYPEGYEGILLSNVGLGKSPECYRCMQRTNLLMPVLVNRHSVKAVTQVARGRMTRLWCHKCCDLEELDFVPYVAYAIDLAWKKRQGLRT